MYTLKCLRGLRRYICNKTKRKVGLISERLAIDSGGVIFAIEL
jgi:hypothetical protein